MIIQELHCRLNGLEQYSPSKIILDRYLKVSSNYKIYKSSPSNDIIIYSLSDMKNHLTENKLI